MTTLFYLFGIVVIFHELLWVYNPKERAENSRRLKEFNAEFKGKKWDEFSEEYKIKIKGSIISLLVFGWLIVGLFSVQWAGFAAILVFNIAVIYPISQIAPFSLFYIGLHWFNSVIGLIFAVFIIVNHYHLHIDLAKFIAHFLP